MIYFDYERGCAVLEKGHRPIDPSAGLGQSRGRQIVFMNLDIQDGVSRHISMYNEYLRHNEHKWPCALHSSQIIDDIKG